jgi:cell division protein FtsI (penicillin-binding protein 3)
VSVIVVRLVQLQGVESAHYRTLSSQWHVATMPLPAARGAIVASDGSVLAMTVRTYQVGAGPQDIARARLPFGQVAAKLSGPLRMTTARIVWLLRHPTSPDYVELKTSIDATTANQVRALGLTGLITLTPTYQREYPEGVLAAPLLGFTDVNQQTQVMTGQAGLEQEYNALLAGRSGAELTQVDPVGNPIPGTQSKLRPAESAGSLRLTIQTDIQWKAERECALQVAATRARTCTVVVMQPATGRILALAQYPSFNPAAPASLAATRDIAVGSQFAPGSTAKVITAAAAFTYGGQGPLSTYRVPDTLLWHGTWYRDAEWHPTQRYTIAGIIAHSLNDGMIQVADHVTPMEQYRMFRAFGIGSPSGLNLPGEISGTLPPPPWTGNYRNERYQLSFGQSVDVTAIQMASVYATIANGGVRVTPTLIAGHTTSSGRYIPARAPAKRRVISGKVAAELMSALEQVPITYAQAGELWGLIPGYSVAAKTGTAQQLPGNTYGSSFIGIAPASSSGLVVAVNIQDPRRGSYFGIDVAGPVFNAVMRFALATMKISPDGGHVPYVPLTVP